MLCIILGLSPYWCLFTIQGHLERFEDLFGYYNLGRNYWHLQASSVQSSHAVMSDSVTPWTAARQASLSITNSQSPLKPMSIKSVMPSNHLILCHPHLLLPSVFPSIRVFSNESVHLRWPKYWSFSFTISPSNAAKLLQVH